MKNIKKTTTLPFLSNRPLGFSQAINHWLFALFFFLLFFCLSRGISRAGEFAAKWDEIVGKQVLNHQGVKLGYVEDTAIDLEHGRYFGLVIRSGGIFGGRTQIVPAGALMQNSTPDTLFLNMDKTQFRNAPALKLSEDRGSPNIAEAVALYHYYGQQPYFASKLTPNNNKNGKLVQLGYIIKGTQIIHLPVENLQGKPLGNVKALVNLDTRTGRFGGVVIADKIVPPEALRYNFAHTVLRINNHEQAFSDSTPFKFSGTGASYSTPRSPMRPGIPLPPLQQGNSERDKAATKQITSRISESNMSHYAKHIQVGTVLGITTVRGRVQSQREKNQIESYALQVSGRGKVINMLDVRPITAADKSVDQDM